MQFRDLQRQYKALKVEMDSAIQRVVSSAHFIMGEEVASLEHRLSEYVGVKNCVACANGTDALRLTMMLSQIGEGDAVFVPDFTFYATAEVVLAHGATPIFVDVEEHTFNMDVVDLERKIAEVTAQGNLRPKAIMAVDLFGLPANFRDISLLADRQKLLLIEDAAQGFGGTLNEQRACSFGAMSATSFFPAKPLGCYGDGGAFFTNDDELAQKARSIIQHGKGSNKYENVRVGLNSRLDSLQAAVLHVKLDAFDKELESCQKMANMYDTLLSDIVKTPQVPSEFLSSWAQYTIRLEDKNQRDMLKLQLADRDIPSMIYYPIPLRRQPVFAHLHQDSCPTASRLSDTVLSLPMHPYLTSEEVHHVANTIREALTTSRK